MLETTFLQKAEIGGMKKNNQAKGLLHQHNNTFNYKGGIKRKRLVSKHGKVIQLKILILISVRFFAVQSLITTVVSSYNLFLTHLYAVSHPLKNKYTH
jgi:hypothetical protein